jgi:AcrR family transcriptional regulator
MSTIKKSSDTYHHGHMRDAVIAAALRIVVKEGAAALTIRSIAKLAGVTHAAIYHHFADREAILASVATHGFGLLQRDLDATESKARSALGRFRRMGLAYVAFARANPRLYEVMFGADVAKREQYPDLAHAATTMIVTLRDVIATCQADGTVVAGPPEQHALFAVSAVHGISSLLINHQLDEMASELELARVADLIVHRVLDGLAPRG